MSTTPAQHRYKPQHVKTGHTAALTTAGLAGLLLPLVLSAGMASAAETPVPASSAVTAPSLAGVLVPAALQESSGAAAATATPSVAPGTTGRPAQPAAASAQPTAPDVVRSVAERTARTQVADLREGTELKISGPLTQAAGRKTVAAGQLFAGAPVQGETVELQIQRRDGGWRTITRAVTDVHGVARMNYQLGTTTRVRTYFPGDADHKATASDAPSVTVQAPPAPPAPVLTLGERAVAGAATHYGKAYRYGATGPSNFDCSGLTGYVYRQLGVNLPRTSGQQERALPRVAFADARVGDLIFTWTGGRVSHVGIYMGGDMMYASTTTGDITRPQRIWSSNITVGRIG